MEPIHQELYKGYSISIHQDEDPENPITDWDTEIKLVCLHSRHNLGNVDEFKTPSEVIEYLETFSSILYRPLYLLDHSGLNLKMDPSAFQACDAQQWDWGQVGYVYAERIPGVTDEELLKSMQSEVEVYDQYLRGDVYGYVVENTEGMDDSLWGRYGFDYCLEEARSAVDYLVKKKLSSHLEKVKVWIRNSVPLHHRKGCGVLCV